MVLSLSLQIRFSFSLLRSRSLFETLSLSVSQRICFCSLGFPLGLRTENSRNEFLETVATIEALRADPSLHRPRDSGTVQVLVPKVVPPPPPPSLQAEAALGDGDEVLLSARTKRAAMQRKAAVASMVAEDYARRFESGAMPVRFLRYRFIGFCVVSLNLGV